jgi:hypothetical protein
LQDLIKPDNVDLRIRENSDNGVFISGAETLIVSNLAQCQDILKLADKNRAISSTL